MSDTTPVTVVVSPLIKAFGKSRLRFTTVVELEIAGIAITLQGVAVTSDQRGNLRVELPQTRHPNGTYYPCIAVPIELHRAIEVEVLSLVPGSSRIIVTDGAGP
jgi:hypothetical protein